MTFAVNSDGDHQRHIWRKNDKLETWFKMRPRDQALPVNRKNKKKKKIEPRCNFATRGQKTFCRCPFFCSSEFGFKSDSKRGMIYDRKKIF